MIGVSELCYKLWYSLSSIEVSCVLQIDNFVFILILINGIHYTTAECLFMLFSGFSYILTWQLDI